MTLATTRLGRTGLVVSRLALGTMTFGLQTDEETSRRILDKAADAGIDFLDTADVYPLGGDWRTAGRTEEIVGRWLRERGRSHFVLATKAVGRMGPTPRDEGPSRRHLLAAVDASLARLQTDHVDLYQLHWDTPLAPIDETLEALDAIVRSGRARYVGVSNFLAWRLAKALGRAELLRVAKFVSVQPRYSLLFREIERELLPLAVEEGLGVIPYNPLAGGMLTAKHRAGTPPTPGTRFALGTAAERYQERYWNERSFATVEKLHALADERGVAARHPRRRLGDGQPGGHRAAARREPARAARRHDRRRLLRDRRRAEAPPRRADGRVPARRRGALSACPSARRRRARGTFRTRRCRTKDPTRGSPNPPTGSSFAARSSARESAPRPCGRRSRPRRCQTLAPHLGSPGRTRRRRDAHDRFAGSK